ncbi:hypothetical protein CsSME_00021909 [Camellia sinensis var. sinensis]
MSSRLFFNSKGEGKTLAELDSMNRGSELPRTGARASAKHERRHSPRRRSRSPRKEKHPRAVPLVCAAKPVGHHAH